MSDTEIINNIKNYWMKYYLGYNEPTCLIRIGPMGSGKTSAIDKFVENNLKISSLNFPLVDLDKIITENEIYKSKLDLLRSSGMINPESLNQLWYKVEKDISGYNLRENIIEKILEKKNNYSVESTGSYLCPNKNTLWKNFKQGYRIVVILPYVTFNQLKDRVRIRADSEGRDVDEASLLNNYKNVYQKILGLMSLPIDFYFINNMVGLHEVPELIVSTSFNSKSDESDCINGVYYNEELLNRLIDEVKSDLQVKEEMKIFFTKLKSFFQNNQSRIKYLKYKKKYLALKKQIN